MAKAIIGKEKCSGRWVFLCLLEGEEEKIKTVDYIRERRQKQPKEMNRYKLFMKVGEVDSKSIWTKLERMNKDK